MSEFLVKIYCLHDISYTNWQILAELACLYQWNRPKDWLDFADLDPIFKVSRGV